MGREVTTLMADELSDFGRRLAQVADGSAMRRIVNKAGMAGKKSALDAAEKDLGDRAFSGMRRKVKLSAGFDTVGDSQVKINFRPPGLWRLAEDGRNKSGGIFPRAGNRKGKGTVGGRAVMTPQGPRARSGFGPSRGLGTFTEAVNDAQREVPKAAARQFADEVRKVVR
jgi:hypothetical protein